MDLIRLSLRGMP